MTTFTAKYLAPLNPGNKYLFDRNEAARRNPVRRIPASQYTPMPGQSAAGLITAGYDIKAAVPGGLWVQKDREVYYCNSGRPLETEPLCWRLREPSAGNFC